MPLILTLFIPLMGFNLQLQGGIIINSYSVKPAEVEIPQFDNAVLITWDGCSKKYFENISRMVLL